MIGLLALFAIGVAWFTLVMPELIAAKRQIGTAVATTLITLFTSGCSIAFVLIIARLFAHLYELLTDVGDCLVDVATALRHFEQSGALRRAGSADLMDTPASFAEEIPAASAPVEPADIASWRRGFAPEHTSAAASAVFMAPPQHASAPIAVQPPAQRTGDPESAPALGASAGDLTAAHLLQLAQKHNRNGNKSEAVRCLKAIIERHPASASASTARAALGTQR